MQHHVTLVRSAEPLLYTVDAKLQITYITHERVGVDEVRAIIQQASLRPAEGNEHVFVVRTNFVTHEAQNALLKLFEEPPAGLLFQLIIPASLALLPTLMSRVGNELIEDISLDDLVWRSFIAASPAARLKLIDDWNKSKDGQWLQAIVRGVHSVPSSEVPVAAWPVLQLVGQKLATRGASNKMLLEHLALALPLRK